MENYAEMFEKLIPGLLNIFLLMPPIKTIKNSQLI